MAGLSAMLAVSTAAVAQETITSGASIQQTGALANTGRY